MRLSLDETGRALQDEVRAFLAERLPSYRDLPSDFEERTERLRAWQGELHQAGLLAVAWPTELGGRGATLREQVIVDREMARSRAPELVGAVGLTVIGPSLIAYGTEQQKAAHLERILSAEDIWCQGFSEPEAGSDLASLKTTAVDAGDHFVLRGQKTWTTMASAARYCAVLARTDPETSPHRGISYLIVDLRAPGVEVRPLVLVTGEREFGEVFFDDVIVGHDQLLGPLNGGWTIAMHTLAHERGPYAMARQVVLRTVLDRAIAAARRRRRRGRLAIDCEDVRAKLVQAEIAVEVLLHQCYRSVGPQLAGAPPGVGSSIDKIALGRAEQLVADAALDVLGPRAELAEQESQDPDWHAFYLYGRAASVYGGTAQIQLNIIAERLLELPRSS